MRFLYQVMNNLFPRLVLTFSIAYGLPVQAQMSGVPIITDVDQEDLPAPRPVQGVESLQVGSNITSNSSDGSSTSTSGNLLGHSEAAGPRHQLRVRFGAAWQVLSPAGVYDETPTKLGIGIDYGRSLLLRDRVALVLVIPVWLQINTKERYANTFFSSNIGIDFSTSLHGRLWLYSLIAIGIGGGFVQGISNESQVGLAGQVACGLKIFSRTLDVGIEPLSLHLFNALGPSSRGAIVSANILLGLTAKF